MLGTKGNGLTAGNSQPAKTHAKHTTDFIAIAGRIKSALIRFASWLAVMFRGLV
jgi:hypothetical protein